MKLVNFLKRSLSGPNLIEKPYVIAEAGVNHEGDLHLARRLITTRQQRAEPMLLSSKLTRLRRLASVYSPAYWDLEKEPTTSNIIFLRNMITC